MATFRRAQVHFSSTPTPKILFFYIDSVQILGKYDQMNVSDFSSPFGRSPQVSGDFPGNPESLNAIFRILCPCANPRAISSRSDNVGRFPGIFCSYQLAVAMTHGDQDQYSPATENHSVKTISWASVHKSVTFPGLSRFNPLGMHD